MLRVLYIKAFGFDLVRWSYLLSLILTGLVMLLIDVPLLVFCVFLGPNLISWSAKKQGTVAQSSTEADYRALALTVADLSWTTQLLTQLRVSVPRPLSLWCDSLSAIALAHNPVFHARTKHIEIDYHFLHDKVV